MRAAVVSLWVKLNHVLFLFAVKLGDICFDTLCQTKLSRQKLQLEQGIQWNELLSLKPTKFDCLLNFIPPTFFLFFFSFFFFLWNKRGRKRGQRRLVPLTVFLPCDWWKSVARLVSVKESFLLPLRRALIGQVWTGLVDLCHLLNIPTLSVVRSCLGAWNNTAAATHVQSFRLPWLPLSLFFILLTVTDLFYWLRGVFFILFHTHRRKYTAFQKGIRCCLYTAVSVWYHGT